MKKSNTFHSGTVMSRYTDSLKTLMMTNQFLETET